MLTEEIKAAVRAATEAIAAARPNFRRRRSQNLLIAEIAKTCAGEYGEQKHLVAEAPTGTGKSLGYLLSAYPVAKATNRKLVIATATVALQEQLMAKEIPAVLAAMGGAGAPMLAKGRQRYVCDFRLFQAPSSNPDQADLGFDDPAEDPLWASTPTADEARLVESMIAKRKGRQWSGDLDEWPEKVPPSVLEAVTCPASQCASRRCPNFSHCAFYQAREGLSKADLIVANQNLLLADMALESETRILPSPSETIYVIDEGHHFPDKAIEAFAHSTDPKRLIRTARKARGPLSQLASLLKVPPTTLDQLLDRFDGTVNEATRQEHVILQILADTKVDNSRRERVVSLLLSDEHVASLTAEPSVIAMLETLLQNLKSLKLQSDKLVRDGDIPGPQAATLNMRIGAFRERLEAMHSALVGLQRDRDETGAPLAKWIEVEGLTQRIRVSEISAAATLKPFFADAASVVITSATLRAMGSFEAFFDHTGLTARSTRALALPSPFDLPNVATLRVVGGPASANRTAEHTQEVAEAIAKSHSQGAGSVVLFASHRQMRATFDLLSPALREITQCQEDASRDELLKRHAQRVNAGQPAILMGVQGLSEGLDLPGELCKVVIVAKIPFAPPDGPIEQTRERWMASMGRNYFAEVAVPAAHLKLTQSCGRLIRSEEDSGDIVIVDRRLTDTRYGEQMLQALPPYRREDAA